MPIPLVDLKAQYAVIKEELDAAIQRVIDSTAFINGPDLTEFEKEFAAYCGTRHGVGTSSGQTALHTALVALGIGANDEVMTTPMTFIATTAEITHTGAFPVFVDIDPRSFTLDIDKIQEKIETEYFFDERIGSLVNRATYRRLRAIMPVHLYGQMTDMNPLGELAARYNLKLIEDAAQAHGAEYLCRDGQWKRAGSLGVVSIFSFYPSKNLGAYGDGGAVVTNDANLAEYMKMMVNQGRREKYIHAFEGRNYRLDTLQAAILRVKLKYLDRWNEARRRVASIYDNLLRDVDGIITPQVMPYGRHVFHLYVIRTPRRDELARKLNEQSIGAATHYPIPLHLQPAYRYLKYRPGDFPLAEACAREALSLPMYPELGEDQIVQVVNVIKDFLTH
jgi:dTDP-4-amino-4,6-dideoxygalactose transaminase